MVYNMGLKTAEGKIKTSVIYSARGELGIACITYVKVETTAGQQVIADNAIMSLTQNTAHALSVLVYLDGNEVTNADVAATGSTSMTGKMNLQFSSSATLVPMEYSGLYIPGNGGTTETTTPATTEGGN